jgi:TRAP-type C4-dicarboxylate transport system permease small subunit
VGARIENSVVTLALGLMVIVPLIEAILRKAFGTSLPGSIILVPHLTLLVGMIGGVIAAREDRLLALSTAALLLKGKAGERARVFSHGTALGVTVVLAAASGRFVQTEKEAASVFIGSVPLWVVQLLLPLGFALISLHLFWRSAGGWRGRAIALAVGAAVIALPFLWPDNRDRGTLMLLLFGLLFAATILGAPIYVTLGGAALLLFWGDELPIARSPWIIIVRSPTRPSPPCRSLPWPDISWPKEALPAGLCEFSRPWSGSSAEGRRLSRRWSALSLPALPGLPGSRSWRSEAFSCRCSWQPVTRRGARWASSRERDRSDSFSLPVCR